MDARQAHQRMDDDMSIEQLQALKARIRSDDYAVDASAVAAAILSRLMAPCRAQVDGGDSRRGIGDGAPHVTA